MIRVGTAEVDFVGAAIEAELHGLGCLTAIEIVYKGADDSGCHLKTLPAMPARNGGGFVWPRWPEPQPQPWSASALIRSPYRPGPGFLGRGAFFWSCPGCAAAQAWLPAGSVNQVRASLTELKNLVGVAGLCRAV